MANSPRDVIKRYQHLFQHPGIIITGLMLFFYCNWVIFIAPCLKLYKSQQLSNQKLKVLQKQVKNTKVIAPQNLEKILLEKFPEVTSQIDTSHNQMQLKASAKSSAVAIAILNTVLTQALPIVRNFSIAPQKNSNDLELIINFN